jgi:hypothetical protein
MLKVYVHRLQPVQEGDRWRDDVYFGSSREGAWYWEDVDQAEDACRELSRGTVIQSSLGGTYVLTDFNVEQIAPSEFSICCEGPFPAR